MKNSRLINLLKTFDSKEIKKFSEFISSPYFNKNENVIKLFEIIRKDYPDFEKLTRESIFLTLFPGKKYNGNTLRVLIHYLYERANEFLAFGRLKKDIYGYKVELVSELFDRKLNNESTNEINKTISKLEVLDVKDNDYFFNKFIFEYKKLYCLQIKHQEKYEKYFTKTNIETPFKNLTDYYLIEVLTFYCVILNTNILYKVGINTELLSKIIACFDFETFYDRPVIQIYYNMVMALTNKDEKYFYNTKDLVIKYEKDLAPPRVTDIYVNLENYCRRKIRAGETKFKREFFEILKLDLEKRIYKVEPYMSQNFFKNILQNAAELKEFEWAENFIESYKNELRPENREAAYCYCKAFLDAVKNNFEKALEHLSQLQTDEQYLKIDVRLLQARLYYELNEYDVLNSAIDSIRHFLKGNKFIAEIRRVQFSTYINFLSSLNNAQLKKDEMKIVELKDKIQKTTEVQWKDWLIQKVEELEDA